jgi:hypothetical protein
MSQRLAFCLAVAALAISFPGAAVASKQARERVYALFVGDWRLGEHNGSLYMSKGGSGVWHVSVPTFKNHEGKFLAVDPDTGALGLTSEKGGHTHWVFDFRSQLRPQRDPGYGVFVGVRGSTFTMQVAEGKFKDWYLAVEDLTDEQKKRRERDVHRPLKLVRTAKEATVFTYVEEKYSAE